MNAIIYCNREDLPGATIYVTREPCAGCMKMIVGAGIESVVFPTEVGDA
jgi:dCMP deaminase